MHQVRHCHGTATTLWKCHGAGMTLWHCHGSVPLPWNNCTAMALWHCHATSALPWDRSSEMYTGLDTLEWRGHMLQRRDWTEMYTGLDTLDWTAMYTGLQREEGEEKIGREGIRERRGKRDERRAIRET